MSKSPSCAFCQCTNIQCLGQCPKTGDYFCNGRGSCKESHLVYYLLKTGQQSFVLPPANQYSKMRFECYLCKSTNIFDLGIVPSNDHKQFFIVCKNKCLYDKDFVSAKKLNVTAFMPLVRKDQVLPLIIAQPDQNESRSVPMRDIQRVMGRYFDKFNIKPPKKVHKGLPELKMKYDDMNEYLDNMRGFISAERFESFVKAENIQWDSPTSLTFECSTSPDFFRDLRKYKVLRVTSRHNMKKKSEKATLVQERSPMITVSFSYQSAFFQNRTDLLVQIPTKDSTFGECLNGLDFFQSKIPPLFQRVFLGDVEGDFSELNKTKNKIPYKQARHGSLPPLNQSQMEAINYCLSHRFSMVQGPPGTGKTTLLVAMVYSLISSKVKPILVCAATNVAVDHATLKIKELGISVCRVMSDQYYEDDESFHVRDYASRRVSSNKTKYEKKLMKEEEKEKIKNADVILSTCYIASSRLKDYSFKAILFDEAGQLTDPDLICGCIHNPNLVMFVGDHQQLGPIIKAKASMKSKYDIVLLERLVLNHMRPKLLRTQYRMHPEISKFPSQLFYGNLLINGVKKEDRILPFGRFKWPNKNLPIMMWNVKDGTEQSTEGMKSVYNEKEAQCVGQIVGSLCQSGINLDQIGIITPYAAQQEFLKSNIPDYCPNIDDFDQLEIKSVDGFQGREKDIIIISYVRSNPEQNTGFSATRKRLCVSITRAKFGLIQVLNADTYKKSNEMMDMMKYYIENGAFVEGENLNQLHKSSLNIEPPVETDQNNLLDPSNTRHNGSDEGFEEEDEQMIDFF